MEISLSEAEVALIERLLRQYQAGLTKGVGEQELVALLLHKLSHPMLGALDQEDAALLTDVGGSITPMRGVPPARADGRS